MAKRRYYTSEIFTDIQQELSSSIPNRMRSSRMHALGTNTFYRNEVPTGANFDVEDVLPVTPDRMSNPYTPAFQSADAHELYSRSYPTLPCNPGFSYSTPSTSNYYSGSSSLLPLEYSKAWDPYDPEDVHDVSSELEPYQIVGCSTYSNLYNYKEPSLYPDSSPHIAANSSFRDDCFFPLPGESPTSLCVSAVSTRPPVVSPVRGVLGHNAFLSSGSEPAKREKKFKAFHEEKWNAHLEQLREFKKKYGHCLVPHTFPENQNIARWVKRQRRQYKLMLDGKEISTMTPSRAESLNREGFIWDSHEVVWQERYSQLIRYRERHGDCRVPSYSKESPQLASWVKCQRRQYKLFWEGKRSSMSVERTQLLENVGFVWEIRPVLQKQKKKDGMKKLAEFLSGL